MKLPLALVKAKYSILDNPSKPKFLSLMEKGIKHIENVIDTHYTLECITKWSFDEKEKKIFNNMYPLLRIKYIEIKMYHFVDWLTLNPCHQRI